MLITCSFTVLVGRPRGVGGGKRVLPTRADIRDPPLMMYMQLPDERCFFPLFQTTLDSTPVETRATYLLSSIRNGALSEEVRQMAAVQLQRVLSNAFEDFYTKV